MLNIKDTHIYTYINVSTISFVMYCKLHMLFT